MGRHRHNGAYRVWPDAKEESDQSMMKPSQRQKLHKLSLAELRNDYHFNDVVVCCVHGRPCTKATPKHLRSRQTSPARQRVGGASNITSESSFRHVGENKNGYIDLSEFSSVDSRSRPTSKERGAPSSSSSSWDRANSRHNSTFRSPSFNHCKNTTANDDRTLPYARRQTTYEALLNLPTANKRLRCPKDHREKDDDGDDIYENVPNTNLLINFPWKGGFDHYDSEKYKLLVNYYLGEMTREKAERFCGELGNFKLYHRLPSVYSNRVVALLPLFIVYRTSRDKLCHYRILSLNSTGDLRVNLPNQQTFSSLSQLIFHYSTYATCDNDGFADSFPWWTTKDDCSTHSNTYK